MGIDIGQALREGASRTAAKNGLILAAVFAGIALLTTVLLQSLALGFTELLVEAMQEVSPEELEGITQEEYNEFMTEAEEFRDIVPLALGISAGIAAGGLLAVALVAEAVSIIAVRIFSSDETETIPAEIAADNILLATLNGFVGKIIVWGLIILGSIFFLLPGLILAVLFYFVRQEIAIKDKNFVQAMADSWRVTKGNRIEVFLVGFVLVVVSQLEAVTSALLGIVSTTTGLIGAAIVGGLLASFGAAVATRAYVQLDEGDAGAGDEEPKDPYDAALGPDDLPQ